MKYLSLEECKRGFLYAIHARNASIGIFDSEDSSFTISRHKMNKNYIFKEFHWDSGLPWGTVKPLLELCLAPVIEDGRKLLEYLNNHPDIEKARLLHAKAIEEEFHIKVPGHLLIP